MPARRLCCLCALLFAGVTADGGAQTGLTPFRILSIDTAAFPSIELRLELPQNTTELRRLGPRNATVLEDGIQQRVDAFSCPGDSSTRFSVLLLLDRSASMARFADNTSDPDSIKLRAAKSAAAVFLRSLDARDESALCSFSSDYPEGVAAPFFTVNHPFSRDTAALVGALTRIVAAGGTWLWQAMYRALDTLAGRPGRRVLIVLTDGRNQVDSRQYSSQTVIDKASSLGIPIYTVGLGADVDAQLLSAVASASGGRALFSPDAAELETIFRALARDILTDACLLRYTSTNPCRDGSTRQVEVGIRAGAFSTESSGSYTISNDTRRATIFLDPGGDVQAKAMLRVPVLLSQTVSTLLPLDVDLRISYDTTLLDFIGVSSLGSIMAGVQPAATASGGIMRVSMFGHPPLLASGPLCFLDFHARATTKDRTAALRLDGSSASQQCLDAVAGSAGIVSIRACERAHTLTSGKIHVSPAGSLIVPIRAEPEIEAGLPCTVHVRVEYDTADFAYEGFTEAGTLGAGAFFAVTEVKGALLIDLHGETRAAAGELLALRLRPKDSRASRTDTLRLLEAFIETDCRVQAGAESIPVILDGYCEPMLATRAGVASFRIHPNPFEQHARLSIDVNAPSEGELTVHDGEGRLIWHAALRFPGPGKHVYDFDGAQLPAGRYTALLRIGSEQCSRTMLLLR